MAGPGLTMALLSCCFPQSDDALASCEGTARQDIVQLRGCRAADRFGARFLQAKCTGAPVCCCIAGDMFKLRRTGNEDDLRGDHPYVRKENA